jgi:branched-chain amino acid transport system substrate-binding protein
MSVPPTPRPSRRHLLLGAGAALALPYISRGIAAGPIRIGVSAAKGGPLGPTEAGIRRAADLAVLSAGGKVLDQPIELVPIEETSVAYTEANARKAIEQQQIIGLIGGSESSRAIALQKLAVAAKLPLVVHTSMHDDITGKGCNAWTYRVPAPYSVQYNVLGPYLASYGSKKWFTLGVDGTSGPAMLALARQSIKLTDATEVGTAIVPQATRDFADVISKIKASGADVVVSALYGESIAAFLKSWKAAGMTGKLLFAQAGFNDGDGWAAGADAITGFFLKSWHYSNPRNSKEDAAFLKAYLETFKGRPPSGTSWQAYTAMRSLISAIAAAGTPDAAKVRAALENVSWANGDLTLRYRAFDHQLINRLVLLETKTQIKHEYDWWDAEMTLPEKAADLDKTYGTTQQVGCSFGA